MTLYIKKEFNLADFEAWSGGADRLKEIIELDIVEDAQYYIESIFEYDEQAITETDINDILWFEMDGFIEGRLIERSEEILDTMLSEALEYGTLYEIVNDDNEQELLTNMNEEPDDWYGYYDLDEDTVYIEDGKLFVVSNDEVTLSSYVVDLSTGRVLLDDIVEL